MHVHELDFDVLVLPVGHTEHVDARAALYVPASQAARPRRRGACTHRTQAVSTSSQRQRPSLCTPASYRCTSTIHSGRRCQPCRLTFEGAKLGPKAGQAFSWVSESHTTEHGASAPHRCMSGCCRFPPTSSRCCMCTSTSRCWSQHCRSGTSRTRCRSRCTCPLSTLQVVLYRITRTSHVSTPKWATCVWNFLRVQTRARGAGDEGGVVPLHVRLEPEPDVE